VNHRDAIAVLLQSIVSGETGRQPADRERQQAEEHVARCSDCWDVLAVLKTAVTGTPPAGHGRMRELYGCDTVRDDLWQLDGLTPGEIQSQFPDVARHLVWCHACRDRFFEMVQVAREEAQGLYGPPVVVDAPVWRRLEAAGGALRELAEPIVVAIRKGAAAFSRVAEGVTLVPLPADRSGRRTAPETRERIEVGPETPQRIEFALADSPLSADLTVEKADGKAGLHVSIAGGPGLRLGFEVRAATGVLVTSKPITADDRTASFTLPIGDYVLVIHDRASGTRYRINLTIQVEP
jgi:hypothetical protein